MKKNLLLLLPIPLLLFSCSAPMLTLNETTNALRAGESEFRALGSYAERKDQQINNAGAMFSYGISEKFTLQGGFFKANSNVDLSVFRDDYFKLNFGQHSEVYFVNSIFKINNGKAMVSLPIMIHSSTKSFGMSVINPTFRFNLMESKAIRLDAGFKLISPPTPIIISLPCIFGFNFVTSIFLEPSHSWILTPEIGFNSGYGDNRGTGGYAALGFSYRIAPAIKKGMPIPDIGDELPMEVVPNPSKKENDW